MVGYIKDHRKELESDIWKMPPMYHRIWQWMKYNVNHEDNEIPMRDGSKMLIKRGQHLTSVRDIAKGVGWWEGTKKKEPNPKTVDTILKWLEKNLMITIERGQGNRQYTLITLINYGIYNEKKDQGNSKVTPRGEGGKHLADINNNDNNKKTSCPKPKKVYDEDSTPYKLANYLLKRILSVNPDINQPDIQKWSDTMRKVIELDKHDPHEVSKVIQWASKNQFWQGVMLSPESLRKNWNKITVQMKKENEPRYKPNNKLVQLPTVTQSTDEERERIAEMARRQAERNGVSVSYGG